MRLERGCVPRRAGSAAARSQTHAAKHFQPPPPIHPLRLVLRTQSRSVRKLRQERNLCSHPRHQIPPAPSGRHIPLLTELEFISTADSTKMPPRRGCLGLRWQAQRDTAFARTRRLDCSTSPPDQKRRRRSRFASELHDVPVSSVNPTSSNPSAPGCEVRAARR